MIDLSRTMSDQDAVRAERQTLITELRPFQTASPWRSVSQLVTTGFAYLATLAAMYAVFPVSPWLSLALSIPAAGFVVRLFIIQHDCGHGSFFRSARANEIVGWICSLATFTPYANWRRQHAGHHAIWNNLDMRQSGADIYSACLTVREYVALSPSAKLLYKILRHPIIANFILPPLVFLLMYRIPFDAPRSWRKERLGVALTNIALAGALGGLILLFGWVPVAAIQVPIIALASISGVFLFSVQHRFEDSEWMRQADWTATRASLEGTSYLRLPRLLQWFTGNIGFHHIHHLLPRVPNYRLEACHNALLHLYPRVQTLTMADALRAPRFTLWDEATGRMVRFPT